MFDFIARLQQKPKRERKVIAFGTAIGFTSFIVLVWLTTIFLHAGSGTVVVTQDDIAAKQRVAEAELSPIDSLKKSAASASSAFDQVKNFFGNFGKVQYDGK